VPTSITLQQLGYFLSAVRLGSLSAAAEEHFIAQPSLSEQIRRLEHHLGVALFVRTNREADPHRRRANARALRGTHDPGRG
jgi:DNA-binding transcriptional LysR family regulator